MPKFQVSDAYRHCKNSKLYADKPGYTYNPRRCTSNPSRLVYFLVSNSTLNSSEELLVKTGPKADINSDHEYLTWEFTAPSIENLGMIEENILNSLTTS